MNVRSLLILVHVDVPRILSDEKRFNLPGAHPVANEDFIIAAEFHSLFPKCSFAFDEVVF